MASSSAPVWWRHGIQRGLARVAAPLWIPLAAVWLRWILGYRIDDLDEVRRKYRRIREESGAPLLISANHLTMIDSFLIVWALAPPWRYMLHIDDLPWNVPEARNFAATLTSRTLAYLGKCLPIRRGGPRQQIARVLRRVSYLLSRGEVALLFPEGGRSRSGRVQIDSAAWGVGRIVSASPECRVLCVYLRGDHQKTWGDVPRRCDHFRVLLHCIEPKSDERGPRRSRALAQQIVAQLARMERSYFDGRQ